MFQFIYNVMQSISFSIWSIIMTIITGKMVKISHYHMEKNSLDNSAIDICSDKYIKTDKVHLVSEKAKKLIIEDFIEHLSTEGEFYNPVSRANFPIFDGNEIIGESNVYSVMYKCLDNYLNKNCLG